MSVHFIVIGAMLAGITCQAYSETGQTASAIQPIGFREYFNDAQRPIAGDIVAGVTASTPSARIDPERLFVFLPASAAGHPLQVALTAIDGSYDATFDYRLPQTAQGQVQLKVTSKRPDVLRRLSSRSLAVVARVVLGQKPSENPVVIASWTSEPLGGSVDFLVNGLEWDNQVYVAATTAAPSSTFSCARLPTPGQAYDSKCEVPLSALRGRNQVKLVRRRFESYSNILIPVTPP